MRSTHSLHADSALLPSGWARDVRVTMDDHGVIATVESNARAQPADLTLAGKVLLPAPTNLHSHSFQRAMAGLTEFRTGETDSFWTWRDLMYRFLQKIGPDDVEAIAAQVQMEMLEAGYACCVEFHYLHHQPDGGHYDDIAEMAVRIAAAAETTGIGLTLLPVLYRFGGIDGRPADARQSRFICDRGTYEDLLGASRRAVARLPGVGGMGVAPHSLRAVSTDDVEWVGQLLPGDPIHIHVAEQTAEVADVQRSLGAPPVRWLLENAEVNARWCLVHATHMNPGETRDLASSGAVAGLCPITESNLGDGIFDGGRYVSDGGTLGIGSDSNIRISLSEELRTLEYSQRLHERSRAVLSVDEKSVGRSMFDSINTGGAKAAGRNSGAIAAGRIADLITLDAGNVHLAGLQGDRLLDAFAFAGDDRAVRDTFVAGRRLVCDARHIARDSIQAKFLETVTHLRSDV